MLVRQPCMDETPNARRSSGSASLRFCDHGRREVLPISISEMEHFEWDERANLWGALLELCVGASCWWELRAAVVVVVRWVTAFVVVIEAWAVVPAKLRREG